MSNQSLLVGWRKRWNRSLLQFLGRRVRAVIDIEDLAQETYLRLLRAKDLQEVRNPQAYLLRVAGHVIAEWRDRQPPKERWVTLNEDLLVDDSNPEFELDAYISQARLDETLMAMSPLTRAVLLLKFREARSCKQIAQELELTDRQVRRHLTRGYERLRQTLES
jgi:RNA polymerase sigma factor (sigma-70 family)